MIEVEGDIFDEIGKADALCITTNGVLRKNGSAVCGAGIAKEAQVRWPRFETLLGYSIKLCGNKPALILSVGGDLITPQKTIIVSFPTKHHWNDTKSDLSLIEESSHTLLKLANRYTWKRIVLPRPGCLNGNLDWKRVRDKIAPILRDDRFIIYERQKNVPRGNANSAFTTE